MYIYQADCYCDNCGDSICENIEKPEDMDCYDSDDYPKGPYPESIEEADYPQHCGTCQVFLKNPLTTDGIEYVKKTIENNPDSKITQLWAEYYSDCI